MKYLNNFKYHKILYHGSSDKHSILHPSECDVISGDKAVFATNKRWLALCFIPKFEDTDIQIGFVNNIPYMEELKKDAFEVLKISGYIHRVSSKGFKKDNRLGMKSAEFISTSSVNSLGVEKIDNVYMALKDTNVNMIPYDLVLMIKDQS